MENSTDSEYFQILSKQHFSNPNKNCDLVLPWKTWACQAYKHAQTLWALRGAGALTGDCRQIGGKAGRSEWVRTLPWASRIPPHIQRTCLGLGFWGQVRFDLQPHLWLFRIAFIVLSREYVHWREKWTFSRINNVWRWTWAWWAGSDCLIIARTMRMIRNVVCFQRLTIMSLLIKYKETSIHIYLEPAHTYVGRQYTITVKRTASEIRRPCHLPTVWSRESYISTFFSFLMHSSIYNVSVLWGLSKTLSKQKVHVIRSSILP